MGAHNKDFFPCHPRPYTLQARKLLTAEAASSRLQPNAPGAGGDIEIAKKKKKKLWQKGGDVSQLLAPAIPFCNHQIARTLAEKSTPAGSSWQPVDSSCGRSVQDLDMERPPSGFSPTTGPVQLVAAIAPGRGTAKLPACAPPTTPTDPVADPPGIPKTLTIQRISQRLRWSAN